MNKRNKLRKSSLNKKKQKLKKHLNDNQKKERNKNVIDNYIKIIEIHMRIILKLKCIYFKNIFLEKATENFEIRKVKKLCMSAIFFILNNNKDLNTFLSFHHKKVINTI